MHFEKKTQKQNKTPQGILVENQPGVLRREGVSIVPEAAEGAEVQLGPSGNELESEAAEITGKAATTSNKAATREGQARNTG